VGFELRRRARLILFRTGTRGPTRQGTKVWCLPGTSAVNVNYGGGVMTIVCSSGPINMARLTSLAPLNSACPRLTCYYCSARKPRLD
jgi:hypothetical protein